MRRALARGNNSIVATFAGSNNLRMVDQWIDGTPYGCVMACLAQIGRVDMVNGLAGCQYAIMAINTGLPRDIGVIKRTYLPGCRYMTGITRLSCGYMIWAFALRNDVVVATFAGTYNLGMINAGFV